MDEEKPINNRLVSKITVNKFSNHESLLNGHSMKRLLSSPLKDASKLIPLLKWVNTAIQLCEHSHSQWWREPSACWAKQPYLLYIACSGQKCINSHFVHQTYVAVSSERTNSTSPYSTPMPSYLKIRMLR